MILLIAILSILFSSCEVEPMQRFGFDTSVETNSKGNTLFLVSSSPVTIRLTGTIIAEQGSIRAELVDPSGRVAFSEEIVAPDTIKINRTFVAEPGLWKLRYVSSYGTGRITLHAVLLY